MRVVVVGAGMAGLTAAGRLGRAGHDVVVLDKGRRPGGRLSTKELTGGRRADSGAQFFTVRSGELSAEVERWEEAGLVREWCRGFDTDDGHPRYAVRGGMAALAAEMSEGLDVRCSTHVDRIGVAGGELTVTWPEAHGRGAGECAADAVIVTAPVPQAAALLAGVADIPDLPDVSYEPTFSLLIALPEPVRVSASGGRQLADHPIWSFVGDNQAKGASALPAVTLHTTAAFATARFDDPPGELGEELVGAARDLLGFDAVIEHRLHRWRYATPMGTHPDRCWETAVGGGRLILAGDAFDGRRVEGAYLSGRAAADRLISS